MRVSGNFRGNLWVEHYYTWSRCVGLTEADEDDASRHNQRPNFGADLSTRLPHGLRLKPPIANTLPRGMFREGQFAPALPLPCHC